NKEAKEKYGIRTLNRFEEISPKDFDVLIISTSPDAHGDSIRYALQHRKHFFVEHPTSEDGYKEILANKDETMKAPSCTFLFNPAIKTMKKILDEGRIGKALAFQYHMGQYLPDWHPWEDYRDVYFSKKETGACREMFCFELIWLNHLMNSRVKEVTGTITKLSDLDMTADDTITAAVAYENNVRGTLLIDVIARKPYRTLRILGSEGVLEWERFDHAIRIYDAKSKQTKVIPVPKGNPEKGYVNEEEMYIDEMKAFLDAIKGKAPYPYSFEENLTNLRALEKIGCGQHIAA
ncbi:MAG: Gfo/Idh/MocA family oxidoreductase, partial [Parcubacteria group bacterium]|nr:Gfo/Idh/MocA family oxidoreductase [Parcubacteria group bacterium]